MGPYFIFGVSAGLISVGLIVMAIVYRWLFIADKEED